jgi:hypothetical protein
MGSFDDRRRSFEEKLRHEHDLHFKITARRNRLFGAWAADHLGLSAGETEEYVRSVVVANLQQPGDDDILTKVEQDLHAKLHPITRAQLRAKLDEFAKQARAQIMQG